MPLAQVVTQIAINTPAGAVEGDLMIACVAICFFPRSISGQTDPCPAPLPIIVPPAGWTTLLADAPGGENDLGDAGDGDECDRIAVFTRVVAAVEPPTHTFTWAPHLSSAAGFIIDIPQVVNGITPTVDVAAPACTISTGVSNPFDVVAPSVVTVDPDTLLLCIFESRAADFGTTPFTIPPGMSVAGFDPLLAADGANIQTQSAAPIDLGLFIERLASSGPTGTRTSACSVFSFPPGPVFKAMGYSLAISAGGGGGTASGELEIYVREH